MTKCIFVNCRTSGTSTLLRRRTGCCCAPTMTKRIDGLCFGPGTSGTGALKRLGSRCGTCRGFRYCSIIPCVPKGSNILTVYHRCASRSCAILFLLSYGSTGRIYCSSPRICMTKRIPTGRATDATRLCLCTSCSNPSVVPVVLNTTPSGSCAANLTGILLRS